MDLFHSLAADQQKEIMKKLDVLSSESSNAEDNPKKNNAK